MQPRPAFTLRFADGGSLRLGRRTVVMGVLNLTPDSFSDGGRLEGPEQALRAAERMVAAGAAIIDIGGESTRPGAREVPADEEMARVLPAVEAVKARLGVRVSIDTRRAEVARRALDCGADLVNDVSAFRDPAMLPLVVRREVPVVAMHMRGTPRTMQQDTRYDDLLATLVEFLRERVESAVNAGLSGDKILVDPGFGFGKSTGGNLSILKRLFELQRIGRPILVGASRKSFVGAVLDLPVDERLEGSLAVAAYASAHGAHVIRAHDVAATVRVVRVIDAIRDV